MELPDAALFLGGNAETGEIPCRPCKDAAHETLQTKRSEELCQWLMGVKSSSGCCKSCMEMRNYQRDPEGCSGIKVPWAFGPPTAHQGKYQGSGRSRMRHAKRPVEVGPLAVHHGQNHGAGIARGYLASVWTKAWTAGSATLAAWENFSQQDEKRTGEALKKERTRDPYVSSPDIGPLAQNDAGAASRS